MLKKNGKFVATKTKLFSGEGYRLGSVVPRVVGSTSSSKISKDTNGIYFIYNNVCKNFLVIKFVLYL